MANKLPNLKLEELPVGDRAEVWDLAHFMYKGAPSMLRTHAAIAIREDRLGEPIRSRLSLVKKLHDELTYQLSKGDSYNTIRTKLRTTQRFLAWADENHSDDINEAGIKKCFLAYAEYQFQRAKLKKLSENSAAGECHLIAGFFISALELGDSSKGRNIWMRQTRLRAKKKTTKDVDKLNLDHASKIGELCRDLAENLTIETLMAEMPIHLDLSCGEQVNLQPAYGRRASKNPGKSTKPDNGNKSRQGMEGRPINSVSEIFEHGWRCTMINLKIEAEYMIFIAQTGMNGAQAQLIKRDGLRWQSDGDYAIAKVFKGRRKGEALFRAFKEYRPWLKLYTDWLDSLGIESDLLFPFVGQKLESGAIRPMDRIKSICKRIDLKFITPRELRKIRLNWLLRYGLATDTVAELAAHSETTLLSAYEQPHHQTAAFRISKYFVDLEERINSSSGVCESESKAATPLENLPESAPQPDCVSPEGCLFCKHHRDIEGLDYIWMLASHQKLKQIERDDFEVPLNSPATVHPADIVIDSINEKMNSLAEQHTEGEKWVSEARSRIREEEYHPRWDGFITLWELAS